MDTKYMLLAVVLGCMAALVSTRTLPGDTVRKPSGTCPPVDGEFPTYFPDDTDCSLFYECSGGVPNQKQCMAGLCFDSTLNVCAFPNRTLNHGEACTSCDDPPTEAPPCEGGDCPPPPCDNEGNGCPAPAPGEGPVGACPDDQGCGAECHWSSYLPDITNKNIFYQCVWGNPVRMCCPSGLKFDPSCNNGRPCNICR